MEDNYAKILRDGYGIRFYSGMRARTGFVAKTDRGLKEIKKTQRSAGEIVFEHKAKEHLYQKGFQNIGRFCTTLEGSPFFTLDGVQYTVEDAITAQPMDESKQESFLKGAEVLGELHQASAGFICEEKRSNLGTLPKLYERRKNELMRIKKNIDKKSSYNPLDLMVKQNFNYYVEKTEEALSLLLSCGYEQAIQHAEEEKVFCHNAFKGDNIRCMESGELHITGFEECAYDTPLVDLVAYLRRFLKKADGGVGTAEEMMYRYHEKRPLSKQDMDIIVGILTYPDKFMRLCNEYYNKRQVCISPAVRERMEVCIAEKEKQDLFLEEFRKIQWKFL